MSIAEALPPNYRADAPEIPAVPQPRCPTCGADERSEYARGYDYEMQTCSNEWVFVECARCKTVWLDPRPDESQLGVIYPPTYYAYDMSEQLSPMVVLGKKMLDALKFRAILAALDRKPSSFLDVGFGDGRYLRQLAAQGVPKDRIYGIDLASSSTERLRAEGYQVFESRVEDCAAIPESSLDLVSIFHVIEHVADPVGVLRKLAGWLAPGGVLAVETPNLQSWDARMFRETYWGGYHIPRHWTLFNAENLTLALRAAGLEVVAVKYQTGHSFWLYSWHHQLKYRREKPRPCLARRFDPLRSKIALIGFTGFDIARRTLGAKTSAMLLLARKPR